MKLLTFIILISLSSCDYTGTTNFQNYLINQSGHKVSISPYWQGKVKETSITTLQIGEIKMVSEYSERGILGGGGVNANYATEADSILVLFDDSVKVMHFFDTVSNSSSKYLLISSDRNLANLYSYDMVIEDKSDKERLIKYTFIITEEDYLYALGVKK